jgi:diguanylate cyclase (GGDEF)-like protein
LDRTITDGNLITRNIFLISVSCLYLAAMSGPVWGLGWGSSLLAPWSALVLILLVGALWRYIRPGHTFPKTDISLVILLVVSVNLFAVLMGESGEGVRPMNYLLVALCAMFYPLWFNFTASGLILLLEGANVFFMHGAAVPGAFVRLAVYGAWLCGISLVLGKLFQFEYMKKERIIREFKRLTEGAETLRPAEAISEEARKAGDVDAAAVMDRGLKAILETARSAMSAGNAVLFMPADDGESVSLRLAAGDGPFRESALVGHGEGLVGWVLKEKKPLLVHDRASGLSYLEAEGVTRSFVAAPILDNGRMEGIIALDSKESDAFTETDKSTLERFGGLALQLIIAARQSRSVDQDVNKFRALHEISASISTSLDMGTILEKVTVDIKQIVPYDYLTVSFVEGPGTVIFAAVEGYPAGSMPKGEVALDNTYLGWIVENGQPLPLSNFNRTDKMPIFPVKELQSEFRSFFGLPLVNQKKVVGVLTVALKRPGGLDAFQQDILEIIAGQMAVNIDNARLHQTIKLMATTDGLTGLVNHRHFQEKADERFTRAARYPENISLLLFDIDHFKKVNDTYGHPIGDAVLRKVGAMVREAARTVDIAARYGGEEFAVLMENTDEPGAMKMAERIRASIQKTRFVFEGATVPVTVSIGCSSFPSDARDKKELIDRADKALYWAKENGRNRCCAYRTIAGDESAASENI